MVDELNNIDLYTGEESGVSSESNVAPDSCDLFKVQSRNESLADMTARQERILSQAFAERAANVAVETPQVALILA